jgi:hypothetical protein
MHRERMKCNVMIQVPDQLDLSPHVLIDFARIDSAIDL